MQQRSFRAWIVAGALSLSAPVGAIPELGVVMGRGDPALDFVRRLVQREVSHIGAHPPETEFSTRVLSIFDREGVASIFSAAALTARHETDEFTVSRAMEGLGWELVPVIYTYLGPLERFTRPCWTVQEFAGKAVFVVPAGMGGDAVTPGESLCVSANLIRVTALNETRTDLAPFAGFGDYVDLAAPGTNIGVTAPGGLRDQLSNTTAAAALVAAELVKFQRLNPRLRGVALAQRFLRERTETLPVLEGRIAGGFVLKPALKLRSR